MNHLDIYTRIRTVKLDFHEFMAAINEVYEKAYLNGKGDGLKEANEYLK